MSLCTRYSDSAGVAGTPPYYEMMRAQAIHLINAWCSVFPISNADYHARCNNCLLRSLSTQGEKYKIIACVAKAIRETTEAPSSIYMYSIGWRLRLQFGLITMFVG